MLFETYVRDPWGDFKSMGIASSDADTMVSFFRREDGEAPRMCVSSVIREDTLVTVTRAIALTGAEIERNECLFSSVEEATAFEVRVLSSLSLMSD